MSEFNSVFHGFARSSVGETGRVIVHIADDRTEYAARERNAMRDGHKPFIGGRMLKEYKMYLDKEILVGWKIPRTPEADGFRWDGMPGKDSAKGFSLLNQIGDTRSRYESLVGALCFRGLADQATRFNSEGTDDKVMGTALKQGGKTAKNNGPGPLVQGGVWFWDIDRSAASAEARMSALPKDRETAIDRYTVFPVMYDPSIHEVNLDLIKRVWIDREVSHVGVDGIEYDTTDPVRAACTDMQMHLAAMMFLYELSRMFYETQGVGSDLSGSAAIPVMKEWMKNNAAAVKTLREKFNIGLSDKSLRRVSEDNRAQGFAVWSTFEHLLLASKIGPQAYLVDREAGSGKISHENAWLHDVQTRAFSNFLMSIAEANDFYRSRVSGTIETNAALNDEFDTVLKP